MPLLRSATRPQAVQCFFCLSTSVLPPLQTLPPSSSPTRLSFKSSSNDRKGKGRIAEAGTPYNWTCKSCGCHNIKDQAGEMISDLPAMHNSTFNSKSFSLRAKPSSSHLPTASSSSSSTFCHSCLANQTLIMNLLANYLPDDNDPTFPSLYAALPSYLSSLHARYPPVCPQCQPAVDEVLRKADHRAQVEAWGSALKRGAAVNKRGGDEGEADDVVVGAGDEFVWRVRRLLFWAALGVSWGQGIMASVLPNSLTRILRTSLPFPGHVSVSTGLIAFHTISILWIAWDPYWIRRVKSRNRTKVEGRGVWVRNMLIIMLLRIFTSLYLYLGGAGDGSSETALLAAKAGFALEVALILHSLMCIRITEPVAIQLVRPVSLQPSPSLSRTATITDGLPPHPSSPTGLSSLSLGGNPQRTSNPIFGQPSLQNGAPTGPSRPEPEPMDWEPSSGAVLSNGGYTHRPVGWTPDDEDDVPLPRKSDWDNFATNKQRLFPQQAGHDETGLESLLAGWGIGGGAESSAVGRKETVQDGAVMKDRRETMSGWATGVQRVTFGLLVVRLLEMGGISVLADSPTGIAHMDTANLGLLLVELLTTITRLALLALGSSSSTQAAPLSTIGLVVFDVMLRAMALSSHSFIDDILAKVQDPRARCLEWLFWALLDLAGLGAA
ncbi:hypothetical protein IAT38_008064 [Cryptococcus sp. DSM 104549]